MRWQSTCLALALSMAGCSAGEATTTARPPEPVLPPPAPPPPVPVPTTPAPISLPNPTADCTLPPPQTATVQRGLVYGYARGAPLALDLAVPDTPGPHPFVVLIHGGGWRAGERAHVDPELDALSELGYAAATVDYRLLTTSGEHRFPTQVADLRCAIRYLRRNAGRLRLDASRAAALGYSSGAHLALLLGTAADVEGLDDPELASRCEDVTTPSGVSAVVSFFGVSELRVDAAFPRPSERLIDRLLGGPRGERVDMATLASPLAHVDASDAATLLFHATEDPVVPVDQSRRMRAALSAAGVPVRYVEVPGRRHGFRAFPADPGPDRTVTCTTVAFLEAALRTPRDASRSAAGAESPP